MPDWRADIRSRLAPLRLTPGREQDIVDELTQHLDDRYRECRTGGGSEADAIAAAWRELEGAEVLKRGLAPVERPAPFVAPPPGNRASWIAGLWHDTRHALRSMRSRPAFAAATIITIALCMGPMTTVLELANGLVIRPTPGITRPAELFDVEFGTVLPDGFRPSRVSYAEATDLVEGAQHVPAMAGQQPLSVSVAAEGAIPRRVAGFSVSANYFDVLGIPLQAGRAFAPEEDRDPGGGTVVILGDRLARQLFPGLATPVGQRVQLNSLDFDVIGVASPEFRGIGPSDDGALWVPGMAASRINHFPPERWAYPPGRGPFYEYVVRRAQGSSFAAAEQELRARTRALADRHPDTSSRFSTVVPRVKAGLGAPWALQAQALRLIGLFGGVSALLVLLGMANVANLLMFQTLRTSREMGIRQALGASAFRLAQLRLVESVLLAMAGTAAGLGVAWFLGGVIAGFQIRGLAAATMSLDWRVIVAVMAAAVIVGLGFGLAPALMAGRARLTGALGRGVRGGMPRSARVRRTLAAVQLALSLTLLVGALFFLTTLSNLRGVDLGFDPNGVTTLQVNLSSHGYTADRTKEYERVLLERAQHDPQIRSASLAYRIPLGGASFVADVFRTGDDPKSALETVVNPVSRGYFSTMGTPITRGRTFMSDEERPAGGTPSPVILSGALARRLFGDIDPIGLTVSQPRTATSPAEDRLVVGVTGETHWNSVTRAPDLVLFEPLGRESISVTSVVLIMRSDLPRADVVARAQRIAQTLDPAVPLFADQTFNDLIDRQVSEQRLFAWVLGLLGAIGFSLAAVGLHGIVSQTVSERTREFAIRIAMGATPGAVGRLVAMQTGRIAVTGLVGGLGLSALAARAIASQLFGVTTHTPWVYLAAAGSLVVVVAVAVLAPARTAMRVAPIDVLKME